MSNHATNEASGSEHLFADPGGVVYARALFEAVDAANGTEGLKHSCEILESMRAAWDKDRTFRAFFMAAEVRDGQKLEALNKIVSERFPKLTANFLRLLLRRERLHLLPDIAVSFRALLDERVGRTPVTLTTAVPVPEDQFLAWEAQIRDTLGGEPDIEHIVDPSILAGAILRVGDSVTDGSARRQLNDLRKRIIERGTSPHAVQS